MAGFLFGASLCSVACSDSLMVRDFVAVTYPNRASVVRFRLLPRFRNIEAILHPHEGSLRASAERPTHPCLFDYALDRPRGALCRRPRAREHSPWVRTLVAWIYHYPVAVE